jgi:hypothetical protein
LAAGLGLAVLVGGVAAAQDRGGLAPSGTDRFWVQERPLTGMASPDLLAQDYRFSGALGYGVNLAPPPVSRGPLSLDPGPAGALASPGQFSIHNWHFGIDMLQSGAGVRPGSIAQLAMNYGGQVSESLALSVGPTVSVGGDGTSSLLGGPAAGGVLRRLQNEAGVRDYGLRGSAVYSLSDNWALTGVLGYRRSIGELGATQADEQFFSVLGLGYRF